MYGFLRNGFSPGSIPGAEQEAPFCSPKGGKPKRVNLKAQNDAKQK